MAAPFKPDKIEAIHRMVDAGFCNPAEIQRQLRAAEIRAGRKAIGDHVKDYQRSKSDWPIDKPCEPTANLLLTTDKLTATAQASKSTMDPVDEVDEAIQKIAKQRDLRREREVLMAVSGEKSFRAYLEGIMRDVAPRFAALPPAPTKAIGPDTSTETMLFVFSDWHAFEEVKASRTLGFNEFTGPILCERVRRIVSSSLSIKQRLERGNGWRFPEAVIACNGDFISGTIHELEKHSDASNVVHAAYATGLLLAAAIRDLASHFTRVKVKCTAGNHGRLPDAKKKQMKEPTRTWDTAIYLYAMTALSGIDNVEWSIPESFFEVYNIEGWKFCQQHGDDIRSWNNVPYYGIDRFGRNMNALFNSRSERIDYFILSHFHSASEIPAPGGGESFINGSLIGGNEFSIGALGKSDRPVQWLFTINEEFGVASRWPIFGNGRKPMKPYPLPDWPVGS